MPLEQVNTVRIEVLDLMEELEEKVDEVLATSEVSTEPCRN